MPNNSKRRRFTVRKNMDYLIVKKIQEVHGCTENKAWMMHYSRMTDYPTMKTG